MNAVACPRCNDYTKIQGDKPGVCTDCQKEIDLWVHVRHCGRLITQKNVIEFFQKYYVDIRVKDPNTPGYVTIQYCQYIIDPKAIVFLEALEEIKKYLAVGLYLQLEEVSIWWWFKTRIKEVWRDYKYR